MPGTAKSERAGVYIEKATPIRLDFDKTIGNRLDRKFTIDGIKSTKGAREVNSSDNVSTPKNRIKRGDLYEESSQLARGQGTRMRD